MESVITNTQISEHTINLNITEMKKLLFAVLFMLAAQVGMAQASDAFKADVKKLLEISGSNAQMDAAKKQILAMIPTDKQAEFTKEFEKSLQPIYQAQQDFYLKEFTHDDIKQIVKYYESPIGKKMVEKSKVLNENLTTITQEWTMELQGLLMKYQQ